MKHRLLGTLTIVFLAFVSACWGAEVRTPPQNPPTRTMTDAAGRVHVRRQQRTSYAQRKAAAQQRVRALRKGAAAKRLHEVK